MSLSTLEKWYSRQCNGDWEHGKIDRKHDDWIHYWAQKQKFQIHCGPLNLSEAIEIFARWFDSP